MIKNGKLFGKINVIDLLVVLVILVAIAAVVVFVLMPKDGADELVMKFRIEEVDQFVAKKVKIGDSLYDDTYSLDLGKVTDIEIGDSISYGEVSDGVYTINTKEGYYSMIITGECKGNKTNLGAEIAGKKYGVGHTFVLRAGDAKLYLRVYDIMLKEDYDKQQTEQGNENENLKDVKVTLYAPEIETFVAESVEVGEKVKNIEKNCEIGAVSAVNLSESKSYVETEQGIVLVSKPDFSSISIECTVTGELTDEGLKIEGKLLSVGDTFDVRAGSTKLPVMISYIGE